MLLPRHAQDLEKSGLSDNTIEALGFYSADQWEMVSLLARSRPVGPGLVIPYPGSSPPYFRVKPDDPPLQWGKRPKYLAPKGAGNRAYIPPRTRDAISKPRKPLLITEGEKKAAKADQEGFPCIGISGVWCFLQGKRLIADLADIPWARRRVYLVYDSDIRHNPHIRYAAHVLAWELTGRGALVFVVALPDGQSDEKVGLDDFLVANGRESLRVLLSNAKALVDTREGARGGGWLLKVVKGVNEGLRHRFLGRLALKLNHDGWPRDAALPILRASNRANRAPLPAEHVDALGWLWAGRRSPGYPLGLIKGIPPIRKPKMQRACELLHRLLENGPVPAAHVKATAQIEGISWETMKRAKSKERVKSVQKARKWWWRKRPGRRPPSRP